MFTLENPLFNVQSGAIEFDGPTIQPEPAERPVFTEYTSHSVLHFVSIGSQQWFQPVHSVHFVSE